jgi:hypothetical protein
MAGQFGLRFRLPRKSEGSFTCRKSATLDRRLYFPSEGRHAVGFFARKIQRLWPGSNLRSWVPEASMLITRPSKTLKIVGLPCLVSQCAKLHVAGWTHTFSDEVYDFYSVSPEYFGCSLVVTRLRAELFGVRNLAGGLFALFRTSRPFLESIHHPIQLIPILFPGGEAVGTWY